MMRDEVVLCGVGAFIWCNIVVLQSLTEKLHAGEGEIRMLRDEVVL
jgi:hypothetical protein